MPPFTGAGFRCRVQANCVRSDSPTRVSYARKCSRCCRPNGVCQSSGQIGVSLMCATKLITVVTASHGSSSQGISRSPCFSRQHHHTTWHELTWPAGRGRPTRHRLIVTPGRRDVSWSTPASVTCVLERLSSCRLDRPLTCSRPAPSMGPGHVHQMQALNRH